jgi:hypothetical protein
MFIAACSGRRSFFLVPSAATGDRDSSSEMRLNPISGDLNSNGKNFVSFLSEGGEVASRNFNNKNKLSFIVDSLWYGLSKSEMRA